MTNPNRVLNERMKELQTERNSKVMTCDNDCTNAGWEEYILEGSVFDMHVSVASSSDLSKVVDVFCHDRQRMRLVDGWSFVWVKVKAGNKVVTV